MGYAEKRGGYWRGRYKIDRGKYGTVSDDNGETIRFRTKREAERAANEEETKVRNGRRRNPTESRITFGQYVGRWYAAQDLAASTLQNYKRHIEEHLLPAFEHAAIADITASDVAAWEKEERALGYAESSIKTWRATLHLILADAVEEGLRDSNPATRRRGRGKRAGRSRNRGPEKAVTNPLGILLLAERAALLSGRDDEFVAVVLKGYTGMRWGELVGLETQYVRPTGLRVEWQLYELDSGELHRCPPKDDSHRTVDLPEWLFGLVSDHIARTKPKPCTCHGRKYVFGGYRAANGAAQRPGPKLADVARRAGVSVGTASAVLNHPEMVRETTRAKVQRAVGDLGYVRGNGVSGELAAHWRRNSFATWLFHPAATGWYPKKAPQEPRPVPVLADPWPGVPVRGRNATGRAESCWLPIAPGLTPHGLRHTHKTLMVELGTPPKLMDERMGHEDGSVQARYSHVTPDMRQRLVTGLTGVWEAALTARREMAPGSPVAVLDRLLRGGA
ncbi:tyrosine-type recombinase/integrase [Micromonospora thermarum]|uniref:LacI family DNA-binding transcriptional regulator n=1 Tax=Micromonospora thermarum TaxID=2720024 RepID=A0ABX0Z9K0_9ACTN|nr:LacI family DNA-binding transcriptional regulator [Micromonospora thermarum]NJP34138.1 LacI family DNA-binding transcriptional regulator [Micromonospora thermarum]